MTFTIYTSGATKNVPLEFSKQWRKDVAEYYKNSDCKVNVFIPDNYFMYDTNEPKTTKQCRTHFLHKVKTSDIVIVNLSETLNSVGTGMEVQKAIDNDIPVIGFGTKNVYPWLEDSCDVIFDTIQEALEYVTEYYIL